MADYEFNVGTRRVRVSAEVLCDRDGVAGGLSSVEVLDIRRGRHPVRVYRHLWYTSEIRLARLARGAA